MTDDVGDAVGGDQQGAELVDDANLLVGEDVPRRELLLIPVHAPDHLTGGVGPAEPRHALPVLLLQLAGIVDLDADGVVVEAGAPLPLALARVPAHRVKGQQLGNGPIASHHQVSGDPALWVTERVDGRLGVGPGRVVDDQGVGESLGKGAAAIG